MKDTEKASQLVDSMMLITNDIGCAREGAKLVVKEILSLMDLTRFEYLNKPDRVLIKYWEKVLKHIDNYEKR
jgi:hypothetical protein